MTRQAFEQAWDRYWRVAVIVFAIAAAWVTLTTNVDQLRGQVEGKANRSQVDELEKQVDELEKQVDKKLDAVLYLLCRDPRNAGDSECDRSKRR